MELVSDESCSVNHHVQSNSFSTQQWLRICYEFADGLSYIHSKGILHNDLHANNLLISKEHMTAKMIDFGSATLKSCPRKYYLNENEKKVYSKKHSHIAWELRNELGATQCELSDVYSLGRVLKLVGRDCNVAVLTSISNCCRDHTVGRRPCAEVVAEHFRQLL